MVDPLHPTTDQYSASEPLEEWLRGPLLLNSTAIQSLPDNSIGVYILEESHDGEFHVATVGRAADLKRYLAEYIGHYERFLYSCCASEHEAFDRECWLYHRYRPMYTRHHPLRRRASKWDCPVCHGFW